MTAQLADLGPKQPVQCSLQAVSDADASKIDGAAMGTPRQNRRVMEAHFEPVAAGRAPRAADARSTGRLASRLAVICSGVLRSGSEVRIRSRARATWRLCRFASLLSKLCLSGCFAADDDYLRLSKRCLALMDGFLPQTSDCRRAVMGTRVANRKRCNPKADCSTSV